MVQLQLNQIRISPGQRVQLERISWSKFEATLAELGEGRSPRIAYYEGTLEIMAPLPEHETAKVFLGDFVKALLNELEIEWLSLGSTTLKQQLMQQFQIQNLTVLKPLQQLGFMILNISTDR